MRVVTIKSGCPAPTVTNADGSVDPVFQAFAGINLDDHTHGLEAEISDFFAHAVAREPDCLMRHVQRIVLHVKRGESERTSGAMVDLFIVLGTRGMSLRKRMLNLAKPHLDLRMIEFLTANLKRGVSATDVLPAATHSVLTKALSGTTELVKQTRAVESEVRDPLQDARECLEYGQVEEAQRILEAAILEEPERAEVHRDLLEIYSHTADKESFCRMRGRLEPKHQALVKLWEDTAVSFKNAVIQ
jgi:hypothetical protein